MAGKTLERPELEWNDHERLVNHFILTMVAKHYCLEYIAECLAVLIPALGVDSIKAKST